MFNAWYRGESGDTLVTVIIEDKGLLEDHRIEPMLRLSNGLKHDDLAGFKVHKFPNTNLRKVTFGAHGETLERLKQIKSTRGKLNLGFLCCRMVISGQNQQQQGQQVVQAPPPRVMHWSCLRVPFRVSLGLPALNPWKGSNKTPLSLSHQAQCPHKGLGQCLSEGRMTLGPPRLTKQLNKRRG